MRNRHRSTLGCFPVALFLACFAIAGEPAAVRATRRTKLELTLTAADLKNMPRASVRTPNNGKETTYEGVWVHENPKKAGVAQRQQLRGKALASYMLAEAGDGYTVIFSLAEPDPTFLESAVLPADTAHGKALSGAQGRFRLVASKTIPAPGPYGCSPGWRSLR